MAEPHEKPQTAEPENGAQKVNKARMLVSMLGADFAKSSEHPFFRDLAQTAIQPTPAKKLTKPEMSRALEKLVKHLAEPRRAEKLPKPAPKPAEIEEPEESPLADMLTQHPVLIAKHLLTLPAQERISIIRTLPGRTARMVAAYLAELKKDK